MSSTTTQIQLLPRAFVPLPLGAIRPAGWLRRQLRIQADGLSGHLDEFWPDIARQRLDRRQRRGLGARALLARRRRAAGLPAGRRAAEGARSQRWMDYILSASSRRLARARAGRRPALSSTTTPGRSSSAQGADAVPGSHRRRAGHPGHDAVLAPARRAAGRAAALRLGQVPLGRPGAQRPLALRAHRRGLAAGPGRASCAPGLSTGRRTSQTSGTPTSTDRAECAAGHARRQQRHGGQGARRLVAPVAATRPTARPSTT